jgi:hypothetical protein
MSKQTPNPNTPYNKHFRRACGLDSRICRYCHPAAELGQQDVIQGKLYSLIRTSSPAPKELEVRITSLLSQELRYRNKFQPVHYQQLEAAQARKKGHTLEVMIRARLEKRLRHVPKNEGKQTPYLAHAIDVAMHTMATCCRGCVFRWHGFSRNPDHVLTDQEIEILYQVLYTFITQFVLPDGPLRTWLTELPGAVGQPYYEHGDYAFEKQNTGTWTVRKTGSGIPGPLTEWKGFLRKNKVKDATSWGLENWIPQ